MWSSTTFLKLICAQMHGNIICICTVVIDMILMIVRILFNVPGSNKCNIVLCYNLPLKKKIKSYHIPIFQASLILTCWASLAAWSGYASSTSSSSTTPCLSSPQHFAWSRSSQALCGGEFTHGSVWPLVGTGVGRGRCLSRRRLMGLGPRVLRLWVLAMGVILGSKTMV